MVIDEKDGVTVGIDDEVVKRRKVDHIVEVQIVTKESRAVIEGGAILTREEGDLRKECDGLQGVSAGR